jgi:lipopolysaccharide/colanic/teichoic acid biosynthesis glycosyltransferase
MRIFPVLLDSRPAYLGRIPATSVLLMPLGARTLLEHLCARLAQASLNPVTILPSFATDAAYEAALRSACPKVGAVLDARGLAQQVHAHEPSDWLLIADPCNYPADGWELAGLVAELTENPRTVRHLVTSDTSSAGTKEYVQYNEEGRVERIQRFYDGVTWPFASGISCTLLPVSCTFLLKGFPYASLAQLRSALASLGVPGRDIPLPCNAFDLTDERGLLSLSERFVLEAASTTARAGSGARGEAASAPESRVHRSARLLGPVIIQAGVIVEENATIVGPTLLGADCRVGRGATVAQCLVSPGTVVPEDATVLHRVVSDRLVWRGRYGAAVVERRAAGPTAWQRAGAVELRDERPSDPLYARLKCVPEAVLACVVLLLLTPVLLVFAALIRLGSHGPVLYGDTREGRNGRPFRCWKFRTMSVGADTRQRELYTRNQMDGPQFKLHRDPRVTRVGRWLRSTNLDELPQLVNILLGQMSLVGPRPSPFRENQVCVPWRQGRLSVRPGITGLWQVCRRDRANGDFHQWIYFDLLYVQHMSLWLDLKIVVATVITLGGRWSIPVSWILSDRGRREAAAA